MNTHTPSWVASQLTRIQHGRQLWNYRGPSAKQTRKFLGITFDRYMPGFSTVPQSISFLTHVGHKGWSLAGKDWALSLFKVKGRWHFSKDKHPHEPFYRLMLENAPIMSKDEWTNLQNVNTLDNYMTSEQLDTLIKNEFQYDVSMDSEMDGATPPNPRPITDDDKYDYADDPFYTQWPGGTVF